MYMKVEQIHHSSGETETNESEVLNDKDLDQTQECMHAASQLVLVWGSNWNG